MIHHGIIDAMRDEDYCDGSDAVIISTSSRHKDTNGKAAWHLLPYPALEQVIKIREYGVRKYKTEDGWQSVPKREYLDAIARHLSQMMQGKETDPESGLPHAAHIACNALFLASGELP